MRTAHNLTAGLAVLTASLALAATASARTVTETASAELSGGGSVTAMLSYTPKATYDDADIGLTIDRAGQTLVSGRLTSKACPDACEVSQGDGSKAIHVADLQGNGEPVVFVDLYTAGAHCCGVDEFFTYHAATQSYSEYEQVWGDPGYRLEILGGKYVFGTADDRFAYEFTDFAASGLPVRVLSFNGSRMVNVTRQYPSLIQKDAAEWLKDYRSRAPQYSDTVGAIAAWAADEDELGHRAEVASYLKAQAAAGHLNSALDGVKSNGAKFITKLDAFLRATGYLS